MVDESPRHKSQHGLRTSLALCVATVSLVVPLAAPAFGASAAGSSPMGDDQEDDSRQSSEQQGSGQQGSGQQGSEPEVGSPPGPGDAQEPFLCTTELEGLGQPEVDNQDHEGTPVYPESAPDEADRSKDPLGWSKDCRAETRIEYRYRDTAGEVQTLDPGATGLPDDIAYIDTASMLGTDEMALDDTERIPYLFRYERGTLAETRFIYSVAMLVPFSEVTANAPGNDDSGSTDGSGSTDDRGERSLAHWNRRLVYSFGGGVGIGHSQGKLSDDDSQLDVALRLGDAVVYSSGTRTSVHYNLLLAGRVATELKDLFVDTYGEPLYTLGIGGSGGAIQQYVNAQDNPELLDALIPQYSYPDMTTQTINVGDCELLEHYMDVTDADNPRWDDWDNRKIIEGQNTIEGFTSDWQEATGATGSSECIEGWRGATPLALNPTFGLAVGMDDVLMDYAGEIMGKLGAGEPAVPEDFPDLGRLLRLSADEAQWVTWTHWQDAAEAYGIDPETGLARVPWDNVGVQYGLRAVADGQITPEEFLKLNARIGSWKPTSEAVAESCSLVTQMTDETLGAFAKAIGFCEGDEMDQYSSRQMNLAAGGGIAPRTEADVEAITNAFESGLEFDGHVGADIPILDVRHYLEEALDMHNAHQSFVTRERIERTMGNADNQVIWFMDARPEENDAATQELMGEALRVMDDWVLAIQASEDASAASVKPPEAVDACWDTGGEPIASGPDVWDGAVELVLSGRGAWTDEAPAEIDGVTVGDCASQFPLHSTSRVVAGGPITNDVYKCHLKAVDQAVTDGDYGEWEPDSAELERLEEIFPDGVCDWSRRSVGYPAAAGPATQPPEESAAAGAITAEPETPGDSDTSQGALAVIALAVLAVGLTGVFLATNRREAT